MTLRLVATALVLCFLIAGPWSTKASVQEGTPSARTTIAAAEAALAAGETQRAVVLFEQAAAQADSLEAELGHVRASFQAGEFRKAMAFATEVAGEHPDSMEALALLAYLQDRVGRTEQALGLLRPARVRQSDDRALLAATAEILIDRLAGNEATRLLDEWIGRNEPSPDIYRLRARAADATGHPEDGTRWRRKAIDAATRPSRPSARWRAPYFEPLFPDAGVAASGNGFIVDRGRRVLIPLEVAGESNRRLLVRNGLGRVRSGVVESVDRSANTAVMRLDSPYSVAITLKASTPGSPAATRSRFCFVLGFPLASSAEPAYPVMSPCLIFRDNLDDGWIQITSALGPDHRGSPVFDPLGNLQAIALGPGDPALGKTASLGAGSFTRRTDRLGPHVASLLGMSGAARITATPSVEELYERLMPVVVQVVAPR